MSAKIQITAILLLTTAQPLHAAITLDGTLGRSGTINGPNYAITPDLGMQSGNNLFHSFSNFNLVKGDIATFSGPTNIANIISRVTGGSGSSIDGTLKSTISGANMYFLNPAGVMFGPSANIDISGSFHVSTADYLKLGTNGRFDAAIPANSVLTTAEPSAFGFAATKPASITVNGAGSDYAATKYGLNGLYVKAGNTISLIGGDISFDSGTLDNQTVPFYLLAHGGRLNVASVASSGEVVIASDNLNMNGFSDLGNIVFRANGTIDMTPRFFTGTSGNIYIRGNNFQSKDINIGAFSGDSYIGGNIDIRLDGDLLLEKTAIYSSGSQYYKINNATVSNTSKLIAYGEKDIIFDANTINLKGIDSSIESIYEGTNKGGAISLTANDSINIGSSQSGFEAKVFTNSIHNGNSGNITINTPRLLLSDYGFIESWSSLTNSTTANSGDISITAKDIAIANGSSIRGLAGNFLFDANGKSSNITLNTDTLSMTNGASTMDSVSISSNSYGSGGSGSININASKCFTMDGKSDLFGNGATVTASSTTGKCGDISITTGDMLLEKGIYIAGTTRDGIGGDIKLSANTLTFQGGEITTGVSGNGTAGNISVNANTMQIGGAAGSLSPFDNISQLDSLAVSSGDAGSISLWGNKAVIGKGGRVAVTTESTGNGGDISVVSDSLTIEGGKILASAAGSGNAGNISIQSANVNLTDNAVLSAESSGTGKAGAIGLIVDNDLTLTDSSITTATANADGGSITIDPTLVHLKNSSITTSVKGGTGSGGNIDLTTKQLILDNSKIVAQAEVGNGGNININADVIIQSPTGSLISASSNLGVQGTVILSSPVLDVNAALVDMPSSLRDISSLSPRRCLTSGDDISSFVVYACGASSRQPDAAIIGK